MVPFSPSEEITQQWLWRLGRAAAKLRINEVQLSANGKDILIPIATGDFAALVLELRVLVAASEEASAP